MSAVCQLEQFRTRHLLGNYFDLAHGGVFVVFALQRQYRATNLR
jgi:hypothetical protein